MSGVRGRGFAPAIGGFLTAALVAAVLVAPAGAAPESCAYDPDTKSVSATIASGGQATLIVVGGALHFGATPSACGAATTTNTDSIAIAGEGGSNETLTLDQRGGVFGPGFTAESNAPEIEMTLNLGDATDRVVVYGTEGDDFMAAGQSGLALFEDGDVDVVISPAAVALDVHLLGGADFLNGGGEGGAGFHYLGPITATGSDGDDELRGSENADSLDGGIGNDIFRGHEGNDVITGGTGNDSLHSGGGDDVMTGGPGQDTYNGSSGNDTTNAQDDEADTSLIGGSGTDTAYVDTGLDAAPTSTETIIGDGPPPPPPGPCVYDAGAKSVTAALTAGQTARFVVVGGAIHFGPTPTACGGATTTNTNSITVTGPAGSSETLILDLTGGAFAPGLAAETDTPEIEITANLGDASDRIEVEGGSANDTFRIGTTGLGLNADADRDLSWGIALTEVEASGGGGVNSLSANGGSGTGSTFAGKAILRAGDGGDLVVGGNGNDELYGGLGNDTLEGRNGNDLMNGSGGNDVLKGGNGDDDMTGGAGADQFVGSSGNDTMRADDDEADSSLSGGPGIDTAYYDLGLDPAALATENRIPA